ncbi:hypothetical protein QYR01_10615 [Brucella anthropi]|uniref:hypothetical protein n=1 Tax=Brucella anthropi TaxID=529 RepID=UPI002673541F|nr:hypothetical protein [Brucella anthropi]WKT94548.1 hypothetical protein QYR01_10615 [Brucella anthropi]
MANTANYNWPLPSPSGIQMNEVAKIATSFTAIDAKIKAFETSFSNHKHKFAELEEKPTTLGGYGITDGMTAEEVAQAIKTAVDDLINGSGAALDTLKELADALNNDPEFATTVGNALGVRVRVDAAQSFSLAQKAQGRGNLDALGTVDKGKANGVASLDGTGKVPATQLPAMDYLPLTGGKVNGNTDIRAGSKAAQAFPLSLGWSGTASPIWQAVLETNGDLTLAGYNGDTGAWMQSPLTLKRGGGISVTGNVNAGASGVLEGNGNLWGSIWGTNLYNYLHAAGTLLGAAAYPRRSDGAKIVFNWSGQAGQPSWIWGGNDGYNMYVYNPANWSVNYANSAGNANTLGGADRAYLEGVSYNYGYSRTRDYLLAENVPVGGYILAQCRNGGGTGYVAGGGDLYYASGDGSSMQGANNVGYGTWWASGTFSGALSRAASATTIWKRIG